MSQVFTPVKLSSNAQICKKQDGFSLVELIVVIVIVGVLAAVVAPRFIDISKEAKIVALQTIATDMKSAIKLVQSKAWVSGLRPLENNPNALQRELIVDFEFAKVELMYSNLCPESEGELGDAISFLDFLDIDLGDNFQTRVNNQLTFVGYKLPRGYNVGGDGCYVVYDSFAEPNCTVEVITTDC